MKKVLKVLLGLVVVVVGAALAIGFTADPKFDMRHDFVVDAPIGKVWDVASDPKTVPQWMPVHGEEEKIVSVKEAGLLEKVAKAGEQVAKTGDVDMKALSRHTYVHKNGTETTVEVLERDSKKRYVEHVIADTTGMAKIHHEMNWGWEMADAGDGKTRLTPFMYGSSAKPHGTLLIKVMSWTGMGKKFQEQMAKNVETLAKGGKVQN
jgi:hypothetical protein